MRVVTLVFALLLLSNETSLASPLPPLPNEQSSARAQAQIKARAPALLGDQRGMHEQHLVSIPVKNLTATPNGRCAVRSGVPQVRALVLLPNERAQCIYFVALAQ